MEKLIFTKQTTRHTEWCSAVRRLVLGQGWVVLCLYLAYSYYYEYGWPIAVFFLFQALFFFVLECGEYQERMAKSVAEIQCDDEGVRFICEDSSPVFYVEWKQVSEIQVFRDPSSSMEEPKPDGWGHVYITGYYLLEDGTRDFGTVPLPHSKYMTSSGLNLIVFWETYEGSKDKLRKIICCDD